MGSLSKKLVSVALSTVLATGLVPAVALATPTSDLGVEPRYSTLSASADELREAQEAFEAASNNLDAADRALAAAQDRVDQANIAVIRAQDITNAAQALNEAQQAVGAAQAAYESANSTRIQRQTELTQAQQNASQAQEKLNRGAVSFFESIGATNAVNVLTNPSSVVARYQPTGDITGYAQDWAMMRAANDILATANSVRVQEGTDPLSRRTLNALKVDPYLMATAMLHANASGVTFDHMANFGSPYGGSENLAWGYRNPFDGWYTAEKQIWDNARATGSYVDKNSGNTLLVKSGVFGSTSAYGVFSADYDFYMNVGHYLNCTDASDTVFGLAHATSGWTDCFQTSSYAKDTAMTVDAYIQAFNNYYNGLVNAVEPVNQAQANLDAANAAFQDAQTALDNANTQLSAAQETVRAMTGLSMTASQAANYAQQATLDANTELTAAQANLAQKQAEYDAASAAYDEAVENLAEVERVNCVFGHDWWVAEDNSSCEEAGTITYICGNNPAHTYTETVGPRGHEYGPSGTCYLCGKKRPFDWPTEGLEGFAARLYTKILDRDPDQAGYNAQVNALRNGWAPAEIAYNYFNSAEYFLKHESAQRTVERVYQVMFGRAPKGGEEAGWVVKMEDGMSVRAIIQGFSQSQEYRNYFGSLGLDASAIPVYTSYADKAWDEFGNETYAGGNDRDRNQGAAAFAKRMYTIVLGRDDIVGVEGGIDVAGLNVQAGAIANGMPCWQIAFNFFGGAEFQNKDLSNFGVVEIAYRAILGRTGSFDEIADWVNTKERDCYSDTDLVLHFCNSNEFNNICTGYGLTSGMRGPTAATLPTPDRHVYDATRGVCLHCGKVFYDAPPEASEDFAEFFSSLDNVLVSTSAQHPWAVSGSTVVSTNQGAPSENSYDGVLYFDALAPGILTFDYVCSAEEGYDGLFVTINGTSVLWDPGTRTDSCSLRLNAGDLVAIQHYKDEWDDYGEDCTTLYNFAYTPAASYDENAIVGRWLSVDYYYDIDQEWYDYYGYATIQATSEHSLILVDNGETYEFSWTWSDAADGDCNYNITNLDGKTTSSQGVAWVENGDGDFYLSIGYVLYCFERIN